MVWDIVIATANLHTAWFAVGSVRPDDSPPNDQFSVQIDDRLTNAMEQIQNP